MKTATEKRRTAARVNETPAPTTAAPGGALLSLATGAADAANKNGDDKADDRGKVQKLSLMYEGTPGVDGRFLVDRMEKSTVERFQQMADKTPELFAAGKAPAAIDDDDMDMDMSGVLREGYGALYKGLGILLVRGHRLDASQLAAFENPERIDKLVPRTERVLDETVGAKIRKLPGWAQLLMAIGLTGVKMVQDASQIEPPIERPRSTVGGPH